MSAYNAGDPCSSPAPASSASFFPEFSVMGILQVNLSSQLHLFFSIILFLTSQLRPLCLISSTESPSTSLSNQFSSQFFFFFHPWSIHWINWFISLPRMIHSFYDPATKSELTWLLCSFSQDSCPVNEKNKMLLQRFGYLPCIWYLQRFGISLPFYLLCPTSCVIVFCSYFPDGLPITRAIGVLLEIIANVCWALMCIVLFYIY